MEPDAPPPAPSDHPVHAIAAEVTVHLREGRLAEAERVARAAVEAWPEHVLGHGLLAIALHGQARHAEALAAAAAAVTAEPDGAWPRWVFGRTLLAAGRLAEALALADDALARLQDGAEVEASWFLDLRARALLGLGRPAEATAAAEQAAAIAARDAGVQALAGDAWLATDAGRAEGRYVRSLALDPLQPGVLQRLGVARLAQGRRAEAVQAFRAAVEQDPAADGARLLAFGATHPVRLAPWHAALAFGLLAGAAALLLASAFLGGAASTVAGRSGVVLLVVSFPASAWLWRTGRRRLAAEDPRLLALQRDTMARIEDGRIAPPYPRWLGTVVLVVGVLCLLSGLGLLVLQARAVLAYPDRPVPCALAQAAIGAWVAVPDVKLDCATEARVGGRTYVLGRGGAGLPVVVDLEPGGCTGVAAPLVGVHRALHPNLRRSLEQAGFPLPEGPAARLCTSCGPRDDLLGMVISAVLAALGGWITWKGAALRRSIRAR